MFIVNKVFDKPLFTFAYTCVSQKTNVKDLSKRLFQRSFVFYI